MVDVSRERFAEPRTDDRLRLKRLRTRFEGLQREESAWALQEALEALFAAAEKLLPEAAASAPACEALDQIYIAIGELLDAVDPA